MSVVNLSEKKIAIVCDWLVGIGGAERVVLEVHQMFPDAPIYTSQYDPRKIDWFNGADVRTGWLQKIPTALKKFLPLLRQYYFSHLDLTEFDLIISVNFGAESKAVKFRSDAVHVCYCNAPTHYYWSRFNQYLDDPGFPTGFNWLARLALKILIKPLRRWDFKAAQKPTVMIGNSSHISSEIKKYYRREAITVFPPVDIERFRATLTTKRNNNFLVVGRQTPYKKIDLAVVACTRLELPLIVLGGGPEHEKLKTLAGPTITFIDTPSDDVVTRHMLSAQALIFPGLDDFGITPVEALAAGTPVIAYEAGGALDYINDSTGLFFQEQTVDSLMTALTQFRPTKYTSSDIKLFARKFSKQSFQKSLQSVIYTAIQ